jgi:RHS repeat-associated protein
VYICLSNQSNDYVYWDNFQVGITQGNIAEENHYYAYGLKIATLSSKKLGDVYQGSLKNNYLYQGAYAELDDDIGWHDFALRNYDAQIGRWVQQDPYQQFASPYVGMGADPVNNTDPSGGIVIDPIKTLETVVVTATRAKPVTQGISVLSGLSNVTRLAGWAAKVASAINTGITSGQVGIQGPNKNWSEGDLISLIYNAAEGRGDINRNCDLCCLNAFASNLTSLYRSAGPKEYPTNDKMTEAVSPLVALGLASTKLNIQPKIDGRRLTSKSHNGNYQTDAQGNKSFKNWNIKNNVLETISDMTEKDGIGIFAVGIGAEYHSTIIVVVKNPNVTMVGVNGAKFTGSNSGPFYLFVEDIKGVRIGGQGKGDLSHTINEFISGSKAYYQGTLCPGGKCFPHPEKDIDIGTNIYQLYNPAK